MLPIATLAALVDDARQHPIWQFAPPMAIVSLQGVFAAVNPALCRLYGRDEAALIGLSVLDVTHPEELAATRNGLQGLQDEAGPRDFSTEKRYQHPEGHILWLQVEVALARDAAGTPYAFISQVRDITRRREAEQTLALLNSDLQNNAQHCTQQLQTFVEEQRVFAYGVSHELRAPLRVIDGYARQLAKRMDGGDGDDAAMVRRIAENTQRMSRILDGLLDLSRAGSADLQPQTVDISLLAEWVGAELIDFHPDREAQIDVQEGLLAHCDERKARLLLTRLFENSWAFTPPEQPVQIALHGEQREGRLQLCLRDHGRGIDLANATHLFEPFQRVHTPQEGAGSGLGLAIAKRIVERHGGSIRMESDGDGRGSRVCFDLPAPLSD